MQIPDLWGELFMRIDRTLLLVSVGDSPILGPVCEWLLYEIKEPLHTVVYHLGWTRYVPVLRITVDEILSWFD